MKARYHKFTGDVPVVFVQDSVRFMESLGVEVPMHEGRADVDFMQEVNVGPLKMLVFNEGLLRTLTGGLKTPVIEAYLAIWEGCRRFPKNEVKGYTFALKLAERYRRGKTHEIIRKKLKEAHAIDYPKYEPSSTDGTPEDIESKLFVESKEEEMIRKSTLRRFIREEIKSYLNEGRAKKIPEADYSPEEDQQSAIADIKALGKIGISAKFPKMRGAYRGTYNWIEGKHGKHKIQIKRYIEPSQHGINRGRISKLWIADQRGSVLANYDRGWDVKPSDPEVKKLVDQIVGALK